MEMLNGDKRSPVNGQPVDSLLTIFRFVQFVGYHTMYGLWLARFIICLILCQPWRSTRTHSDKNFANLQSTANVPHLLFLSGVFVRTIGGLPSQHLSTCLAELGAEKRWIVCSVLLLLPGLFRVQKLRQEAGSHDLPKKHSFMLGVVAEDWDGGDLRIRKETKEN